MPRSSIRRPLKGASSFESQTERALWSQAAQIIGLGVQLSGHLEIFDSFAEEARQLDIPIVHPVANPLTVREQINFARSRQLDAAVDILSTGPRTPPLSTLWSIRKSVTEFFGIRKGKSEYNFPTDFPRWTLTRIDTTVKSLRRKIPIGRHQPLADLWQICSSEGSSEAASTLLQVGLNSPHLVIRVASATQLAWIEAFDVCDEIITALVEGCRSRDETLGTMAHDTLQRIDPHHEALKPPQGRTEKAVKEAAPTTSKGESYSITIHGSFARLKRKSSWWRHSGDLFQYLKHNPPLDSSRPGLTPVGHNLYDGWDQFSWTGNYTKDDRLAAAEDLATWCKGHRQPRLDKVFSHSHGGNVALDAAAHHGVKIGLLVAMNTPAHERSVDEWQKIADRVDRILSLRVKFDLVVISDRRYAFAKGITTSGRFPAERVREQRIPLWFDHSKITSSRVWMKHQLDQLVAYEASMAPHGRKHRRTSSR